MFGFKPKLPFTDEERCWVDEGFRRLNRLIGENRMLTAPVVLPTDEFFRDAFEKGALGLERIFRRVCGYMRCVRARLLFVPKEPANLPGFSP